MIPNTELNIWEHSANVRDLYTRRARGEAEMDAHAQAAEILKEHIADGARVLDAGCGSGYFFHSMKNRDMDVEYHGIDYSPTLIDIGRKILPDAGLPPDRLRVQAIEDLNDRYDAVVCLNTLSWCPDFRKPLDRLCQAAGQLVLLRTNLGPETVYRWEEDGYLDDGYNHLKAYWNQYSETEVTAFMEDMGFGVTPIIDHRTNGEMELVVGKPYYWKWLLGIRRVQ